MKQSECLYCDQLVADGEVSQHLAVRHCVTKNLDFLCRVTLDKQNKGNISTVNERKRSCQVSTLLLTSLCHEMIRTVRS